MKLQHGIKTHCLICNTEITHSQNYYDINVRCQNCKTFSSYYLYEKNDFEWRLCYLLIDANKPRISFDIVRKDISITKEQIYLSFDFLNSFKRHYKNNSIPKFIENIFLLK